MKKQIIILWSIFVVCLITTVGLWFAMKNVNPEYEEVQATVISSETKQVVNKKLDQELIFMKLK